MSIRYEIKDIDDLDISDDKTELEIMFCANRQGNHYVDVPIEMIRKLLNTRTETPREMVAKGLMLLNSKETRRLIIDVNEYLAFDIGAKLILSDEAQAEVFDAILEVCKDSEPPKSKG